MPLLLALCLLAQASPNAGAAAKAGDKLTVSVDSELDLEIEVRDGTGESKRVLNVTKKEKFAQEVLEASEGRVRAVRLKCLSSTIQKSGTDTPISAAQPTSLNGVTFTAMRSPAGWSVKDADGSTPMTEGQSLGTWNDATRLLPPGEAKVGATWDVDARDVLGLIAPTSIRDGQGKIACTCSAADGGRVTVSFKGSVNGKARDEAVVNLDLTIASGELIYDLSKGRPVSIKMSGSVQTLYDMVDVFRRPTDDQQEERRKVGEIVVKSRRMEAVFTFGD
jgi:hypothetical protein